MRKLQRVSFSLVGIIAAGVFLAGCKTDITGRWYGRAMLAGERVRMEEIAEDGRPLYAAMVGGSLVTLDLDGNSWYHVDIEGRMDLHEEGKWHRDGDRLILEPKRRNGFDAMHTSARVFEIRRDKELFARTGPVVIKLGRSRDVRFEDAAPRRRR